MLIKFQVRNFRQFHELTMDFTDVRDYCFQKDCLSKHKQPLIKTALIFGSNASGKSNLGFAIFDIVHHLVGEKIPSKPDNYYINADHPDGQPEFTYTFLLNGKEIIYSYAKTDPRSIIYEKLVINKLTIFERTQDHVSAPGLSKAVLQNADPSQPDSKRSFLKLIACDSTLPESSPIRALMNFVNKMLWVGSDFNNPLVETQECADRIEAFIIGNGLTEEFQKFLNINEISETLTVNNDAAGTQRLYCSHKSDLPFFETASAGTIALSAHFYRQHFLNDITFLFIDNFDAFYPFETAKGILQKIKKFKCQTVVTTHNTGLLSHKIVRPDVCFVMKSGILTSFPNLTDRELREGNNLEKLYLSGEFDA